MLKKLFSVLVVISGGLLTQPLLAQCTSTSPANKLALVELFTSEGCSSCPPAERWLGNPKSFNQDNAVALAFHVAYWDYLGWKDVYAKPIFATRQRWLAGLNQNRTVYTPGVFVDSQELSQWDNPKAVQSTIAKANATPAQATVKFERGLPNKTVNIKVQLTEPTLTNHIQLHVATTSLPFTNKIEAGENKGELLKHAHVVNQWLEPVVFGVKPTASTSITVNEKTSAVVALVQDVKTGKVLQVFSAAPSCSAS